MGLPRKLKNMNIFLDGRSYAGEAEEVTLPKLSRKTEAYRAAGMGGAAHLDMGLDDDALKTEFTVGGYVVDVVRQFAKTDVDGVLLRFAGAFQRDDTGEIEAVEITVRGRYQEVDPGTYKVGDTSTMKVSMNCVYYKAVVNGSTLVEIDVMGMVEIIDGVDRLADQRRALGL